MTLIDKCMQTFSALVRLDDLDGVDLMEAAVADLLEAACSDAKRQIAVIDHLAQTVRRQGWSTFFSRVIPEYISQQRVGLASD